MDIYQKLSSTKQKHRWLTHYTSISALECILASRSLLINRLDKVDDLYEEKYCDSFWKGKIFVSCFSHRTTESFMFWKLYAMKKENKGIMIRFPFNDLINQNQIYFDSECSGECLDNVKRTDLSVNIYDVQEAWGCFDITWADIHYTNKFSNYERKDPMYEELKDCVNLKNHDFRQATNPGLIKGIQWNDEKETRLRVTVRPKGLEQVPGSIPYTPFFEKLFLKLSDNLIRRSTIFLNPWANDDFKQTVREIVTLNGFTQMKIQQSTLFGTIRDYD